MVKPTGFQVWVDRYRLWCVDLQPVQTHTQVSKPTGITIPFFFFFVDNLYTTVSKYMCSLASRYQLNQKN